MPSKQHQDKSLRQSHHQRCEKNKKKNALFGSLEDKEGQDNDRQHRKQQPFQKKGKKRNTTRNNQNGQIKSQTQAAKKTNRPAKKPTSWSLSREN